MPDFIRARNDQQKQQRMQEIMAAADQLFASCPYQEITLSAIANRLSWSRGNLYKYVTTKEEIFLALCEEKREAYFAELLERLPAEPGGTLESYAAVWASVLQNHRDYLRYGDILLTIIETNVSIDKLAAFKKKYYAGADVLDQRLAALLHISVETADAVQLMIYFHGIGLNSSCAENPIMRQALRQIGRELRHLDFQASMQQFILMCLEFHSKEKPAYHGTEN